MDLVSILVSLLRAGWPLPDMNDEPAVTNWLTGLAPTLAKIIVRLVPDAPTAADETAIIEAVCAQVPEANGEIIKRLLDLILQLLPVILPLILKPAPAPVPGPVA